MSRYTAEVALYTREAALLVFVYQKWDATINGPAITNQPVFPGGTSNPSVVPQSPTPVAIYNDPLGYAMDRLGIPPAHPELITDADLSRVPTSRWFVMLDLAHYRLITSILGSYVDVDESANGRSQSWSKLADMAQARADKLESLYSSLLTPVVRAAYSGTMRNLPPTTQLPAFGPGYGQLPWGRPVLGGRLFDR